jgi:hypothetical protein
MVTSKRSLLIFSMTLFLVFLSGCVRLILPTSPEELRLKGKTNQEFIVDRNYLLVYRDILRASQCGDYSIQGAERSTRSELRRAEGLALVYVQKNFDTYVLEVRISDRTTSSATVHVWSHYAGEDAVIKSWALGQYSCRQR